MFDLQRCGCCRKSRPDLKLIDQTIRDIDSIFNSYDKSHFKSAFLSRVAKYQNRIKAPLYLPQAKMVASQNLNQFNLNQVQKINVTSREPQFPGPAIKVCKQKPVRTTESLFYSGLQSGIRTKKKAAAGDVEDELYLMEDFISKNSIKSSDLVTIVKNRKYYPHGGNNYLKKILPTVTQSVQLSHQTTVQNRIEQNHLINSAIQQIRKDQPAQIKNFKNSFQTEKYPNQLNIKFRQPNQEFQKNRSPLQSNLISAAFNKSQQQILIPIVQLELYRQPLDETLPKKTVQRALTEAKIPVVSKSIAPPQTFNSQNQQIINSTSSKQRQEIATKKETQRKPSAIVQLQIQLQKNKQDSVTKQLPISRFKDSQLMLIPSDSNTSIQANKKEAQIQKADEQSSISLSLHQSSEQQRKLRGGDDVNARLKRLRDIKEQRQKKLSKIKDSPLSRPVFQKPEHSDVSNDNKQQEDVLKGSKFNRVLGEHARKTTHLRQKLQSKLIARQEVVLADKNQLGSAQFSAQAKAKLQSVFLIYKGLSEGDSTAIANAVREACLGMVALSSRKSEAIKIAKADPGQQMFKIQYTLIADELMKTEPLQANLLRLVLQYGYSVPWKNLQEWTLLMVDSQNTLGKRDLDSIRFRLQGLQQPIDAKTVQRSRSRRRTQQTKKIALKKTIRKLVRPKDWSQVQARLGSGEWEYFQSIQGSLVYFDQNFIQTQVGGRPCQWRKVQARELKLSEQTLTKPIFAKGGDSAFAQLVGCLLDSGLLKDLFRLSTLQSGLISLMINSCSFDLDDFFPTVDGKFPYIQPFQTSIWPLVLQKCLAKILGGYDPLYSQKSAVQLLKCLQGESLQQIKYGQLFTGNCQKFSYLAQLGGHLFSVITIQPLVLGPVPDLIKMLSDKKINYKLTQKGVQLNRSKSGQIFGSWFQVAFKSVGPSVELSNTAQVLSFSCESAGRQCFKLEAPVGYQGNVNLSLLAYKPAVIAANSLRYIASISLSAGQQKTQYFQAGEYVLLVSVSVPCSLRLQTGFLALKQFEAMGKSETMEQGFNAILDKYMVRLVRVSEKLSTKRLVDYEHGLLIQVCKNQFYKDNEIGNSFVSMLEDGVTIIYPSREELLVRRCKPKESLTVVVAARGRALEAYIKSIDNLRVFASKIDKEEYFMSEGLVLGSPI